MNRIIKKLYILFILLTISILSTSCVGNVEIQELAIVTAMGIDLEGNKVIVTVEVIDPTSENREEDNSKLSGVMYIQGEGNTVYDAMRNTGLFFDRGLLFGHSYIIIFGEEFAKKGITDIIDFMLRDSGPREKSYLLVAKGKRADEILGVNAGMVKSTGSYLRNALDNFKYNGKCIPIPLAEYLRYYYDKNNEVVLGTVGIIEKPEIDINKRKENPSIYFLTVGGGSVFKEDKLIGYYSEDEMLGFNFIVGDIKEAVISFKTPVKENLDKKIIGSHSGYTTIKTLKKLINKNIEIREDNIHLNIDIYLTASLMEVNQALDINQKSVLNDIEKACSKEIERLVSNTIEKSKKEFKQDNFSISVLMHHQHPEVWKEIKDDWHNIFTGISYSVNVKTKVVKAGIINLPLNIRDGE